MHNYDHNAIEQKWQTRWEEQGLYTVSDEAEGKEKLYALVEFPYPSGNLHIGHWYAFAVPDIYARANACKGTTCSSRSGSTPSACRPKNAAIKNKLDPKEWTYQNIDHMTTQLRSMGNSFDWSRKVVTSDPDYYRWTQWQFLQFFKNGLAYRATELANWCPSCNTVLCQRAGER
jgi:leucyl-tRNA synthetase